VFKEIKKMKTNIKEKLVHWRSPAVVKTRRSSLQNHTQMRPGVPQEAHGNQVKIFHLLGLAVVKKTLESLPVVDQLRETAGRQ